MVLLTAPKVEFLQEGYIGMHKLDSRRHPDGLAKCGVCTAEFGRTHGISVPIYHCEIPSPSSPPTAVVSDASKAGGRASSWDLFLV